MQAPPAPDVTLIAEFATHSAQPAEVQPAAVPEAERTIRAAPAAPAVQPIPYTDEPWQDAIIDKFKAAGFRYDGFGDWHCPMLSAPEMLALGVSLSATHPVPAPAQEGEALRTALKRIVSRFDLEEHVKTLGVDCDQEHLHRLYRMPSIRTIAEEALRAAPPPVPVAPMGLTDTDVFALIGHSEVLRFEGKVDMPAYFMDLAARLADAMGNRPMADRCRQLAAAPAPVQQETGHE